MRIAVLRALGLGDLLTGVPALRALRREHPDARLLLGAPAALQPLVELIGADLELADVGPFVDRPPVGPLAADLVAADLAVNLHGAGPESTALLRASGPQRLISFGLTSDWRADEHEVQRWCRLLAEAGIPADPDDLLLHRPAAASPAPGAVVLHPGAAAPARRWPASRWAAVARELSGDGWRVVLTGGPDETALASRVAAEAGLGEEAVLAGRTPLDALAALVADAALLLCGDTGLAHLATAYRTRSVLLFGPTPPALWGPPPRPEHQVLWAGETGDPYAGRPAAGLLAVAMTDVLAASRLLLAGRRPKHLVTGIDPRLPARVTNALDRNGSGA